MPTHLTLVTSDRPATLMDRLAAHLAESPLSPFEEEIVVVQSLGMERWVQHELARRHGCAASMRFPFPAAFCHRLAGALSGGDARALDERFGRDVLTWRILDALERGLADASPFEPLRAFVAGADTRKRLGLAARLAGRFDDYQLYRPDLLLAWERGEDGDGAEGNAHVRWQAALWRRLRAVSEEPPRHLARWLTGVVEELEARTEAPRGLPRRISVFGVSTLPPLFVRLLRAAARFAPVRIYVVAPPRATWRDDEPPANPLFAAFGAASRELLALCAEGGAAWEESHDVHATSASASVLHRLQNDLRSGIARGHEAGLDAPMPLTPDDASLSLHVCHSPMREMEVLRDQLLDAFAADPTLRPHDVLVLVPDVARYAPFVEAVFGVGEPDLPRIPYHVADRPMVQESSLAEAALRILRLAGARWTATEVLELLELPTVRRAAGIADGALARILGWIEETRIRWGRDGAMRREAFDVPAEEANTWRAGLDRLIMGYAVGPEEALVADVLPAAGHTVGDPETLGAFAQWVERLFDRLDDWRAPRSLAAWSESLGDAMQALLDPGDEGEEQALARLLAAVGTLRALGDAAGYDREVDVTVVRDWLERALSDDSMGSGFLLGGMTVCALKPMRAIPFRVIAMAGLDDATFPRSDRRAAFDLLEIAPRAGDRNLRLDDRQLFLDTLLSAGDRMILSYVGRSARNDAVRAPSVVVAELLDLVDRGFAHPADDAEGTARRAREAITVEHRLQPFSAEYYRGDGSRLFSYSRANARASAAVAGERRKTDPFVIASLPSAATTAARLHIDLATLARCWMNPSRFFCERVLELRLLGAEEPLGECEPLEVDNLTRYAVAERIARRHVDGARDPERERREAIARGDLPPGALAPRWFNAIDGGLTGFLERVGRPVFVEPVAIHVAGDGWTLTGRVDGVTAHGRTVYRPAKLKARDLADAWLAHVALAAMAATPGGRPRTTLHALDAHILFDLVDEHDPMALLDELVAGYREALSEPLPVFERASFEFVKRRLKEEERAERIASGASGGRELKEASEMARDAYMADEFSGQGDLSDPYIALCWRGRDPFAAGSSFARWSEALWRPALTAMHDLLKQSAEVEE